MNTDMYGYLTGLAEYNLYITKTTMALMEILGESKVYGLASEKTFSNDMKKVLCKR